MPFTGKPQSFYVLQEVRPQHQPHRSQWPRQLERPAVSRDDYVNEAGRNNSALVVGVTTKPAALEKMKHSTLQTSLKRSNGFGIFLILESSATSTSSKSLDAQNRKKKTHRRHTYTWQMAIRAAVDAGGQWEWTSKKSTGFRTRKHVWLRTLC
jgi:hypothetical protein